MLRDFYRFILSLYYGYFIVFFISILLNNNYNINKFKKKMMCKEWVITSNLPTKKNIGNNTYTY